ncbi:hypothetical protein BLA29_011027, partial [Euroglyphus maynei]
QLAEANLPQITVDEVSQLDTAATTAENNDQFMAIEQPMEEEPPSLQSLNDDNDDDGKLEKKSRFKKPKINLTTARIRSSMKGVRLPRSFRTNKKKLNVQDPSTMTTDFDEKLNPKISLLKRRPFKRLNRYEQNKQQQQHLPRLPDIPESQSSSSGSHKESPQLYQRSRSHNSMEIEFPVGIPLDAPYEEEYDEPVSSFDHSPFHRYPDQDVHGTEQKILEEIEP